MIGQKNHKLAPVRLVLVSGGARGDKLALADIGLVLGLVNLCKDFRVTLGKTP
jgi:hypothetical protein